MMKHAEAKMPFEKVPVHAKALDADVWHVMCLAIEQYWPGLLDVITETFGHIASRNELQLLNALRASSGNMDPAFTSTEIKAVVALIVGLRQETNAQ